MISYSLQKCSGGIITLRFECGCGYIASFDLSAFDHDQDIRSYYTCPDCRHRAHVKVSVQDLNNVKGRNISGIPKILMRV